MNKNRETYDQARRRIVSLAKGRSGSILGPNGNDYVNIPDLITIRSTDTLDPIGGLDPFGEMDGLDEDVDELGNF